MSETVPGECSSGDCNENAIWYLEHLAPPPGSPRYKRVKPAKLWAREFCHAHMIRCLDVKLSEVRPKDVLTMERLRWE